MIRLKWAINLIWFLFHTYIFAFSDWVVYTQIYENPDPQQILQCTINNVKMFVKGMYCPFIHSPMTFYLFDTLTFFRPYKVICHFVTNSSYICLFTLCF